MKKGLAVEGFIREDGTVGPLQTYDDTELRGKIQKNVDEIDNLKSSVSDLTDRVEDIEEHGRKNPPNSNSSLARRGYVPRL